MSNVLRELLGRRVLSSAAALYAAQFAHYVLPLLMIPYLARVLGADAWGVILFIQAVGMYLMLIIEYSFELSATRQVARNEDDLTVMTQVVSGVLGARLVLAAMCITVVAVAQLVVPAFQSLGWLLWLGVLWYTAVALRPFWFFLGVERVGRFVGVEVSTRVLAVAGIIALVNSPGDAWMVLAFQGAATVITVIVGMGMMYRTVPFQLPSIERTREALRDGWRMFLFRASRSVYSESNTIILGFLAAPAIVAFYAGAQRINHSLFTMMQPLVQSIFPRVSSIAKESHDAAARVARVTMSSLFVIAALGCTVLYFLAPLVIRVILGPGYDEAVPVFRILLLLLPLQAISMPLGTHWMIPVGLDSLLMRVTIAAGMMHLPLAVTLGSQFQHIGIAWAIVITEALMLTTLMTILLVRGLGPFRMRVFEHKQESRVAP